MDKAVWMAKVDELAKWMSLAEDAKKEIDKLKGEFQKQAMKDLENKKVKRVEFWGSAGAKVEVTTSETLKLVSYNFLLQVIGEVLLRDFVKIEPNYNLSAPFKRILTAIFQGDYMEQPVEDVIAQISDDEKTRKLLKKKLKGNWEKDLANLKVIAGLNEEEAEHFAYFIQEAKNYEKILHLLEAAGHARDSQEFKVALEAIRHAVVVEEGIKVSLEIEKVA
ncbi:hypothetical protein DCCM_3230 [Desulfocucumis palustris]|uniref:Uncharacterized protein n=1 Tax=Desulfocucumis palustris TaxID=1898651 RepID=A0A2L2XCZ6_9FIRM|nr:hypothetical protein [Desulfocucumis palustris]GBF34118.1 hypothetical protein DCCM_3230 [Desulfocucumis palustris]